MNIEDPIEDNFLPRFQNDLRKQEMHFDIEDIKNILNKNNIHNPYKFLDMNSVYDRFKKVYLKRIQEINSKLKQLNLSNDDLDKIYSYLGNSYIRISDIEIRDKYNNQEIWTCLQALNIQGKIDHKLLGYRKAES